MSYETKKPSLKLIYSKPVNEKEILRQAACRLRLKGFQELADKIIKIAEQELK
jgi:hypothetical protein